MRKFEDLRVRPSGVSGSIAEDAGPASRDDAEDAEDAEE